MKKIFSLVHVFENEDLFEEIRELGVFSTKEKAQLALETLKNDPFLTTCPDGFTVFKLEIYDYEINKISSWKSGY